MTAKPRNEAKVQLPKPPMKLDETLVFDFSPDTWERFEAGHLKGLSKTRIAEWRHMAAAMRSAGETAGYPVSAVPAGTLNGAVERVQAPSRQKAYPQQLKIYHKWCAEHMPKQPAAEPVAPPKDEAPAEPAPAAEAAPVSQADILTGLLPPFDARQAELLHDATLRWLEYGHALAALNRYTVA